ncbi:MAG: hypothetical protein ACK55G_17470, partial [Dolichospermum sp.]
RNLFYMFHGTYLHSFREWNVSTFFSGMERLYILFGNGTSLHSFREWNVSTFFSGIERLYILFGNGTSLA